MTRPPAGFLSHSTVDADIARRLARDLRDNGVDVWYAEWELRPGDSLRRRIDEGVDRATHFLVLLTTASLASEWVHIELDAAMVNRISGKCRLIPVLLGIRAEDVPATLRGLVWVSLDPYESGARKLIEVCHDISRKPPLGAAPNWASERPLPNAGLSPHAQRLAAFLNLNSKEGLDHEYVEQQALLDALELTPEGLGGAASELEDLGLVELLKTMGCGPAGFSDLSPTATFFIVTDPLLQDWNPSEDATTLAAAMVNSGEDHASLAEMDALLGWGPRRIDPRRRVPVATRNHSTA
ncbi:MAG: toll/interleukin-1 receptor domain-containing protein [Vicinamibacterales bacterium]